jgi:hypothetical protein
MMAALQGANIVGADTRCTENGTSSLSAFIRIARPEDPIGGFYCDLNVPEVPEGMEPIDSLQTLFDAWWETVVGVGENSMQADFGIYPNPASDYVTVGQLDSWTVGQSAVGRKEDVRIRILSTVGKVVKEIQWNIAVNQAVRIDISDLPPGVYFISIYSGTVLAESHKLIVIK